MIYGVFKKKKLGLVFNDGRQNTAGAPIFVVLQ
jgi:hypothetical protein